MADTIYKLTPTIREEKTSPVVGVLDKNIKLPKWNPALYIPNKPFINLPIEVHQTHISPYLHDYARMTHIEIKNWCAQSRLKTSNNTMDNLHSIFQWLSEQGYLTSEQKIIFQTTELWTESLWTGELLDKRWSLAQNNLEILDINPLFNNGLLEDIDSFEFRWWYLSVVYNLPGFNNILNNNWIKPQNNQVNYNPVDILELEEDVLLEGLDNRFISSENGNLLSSDKYIRPQLIVLYNTRNWFQILCQAPLPLEKYIVEAKYPEVRSQIDILPGAVQSSLIFTQDPGWEPLEYYHMNILAYNFILSQPTLPDLIPKNINSIIDHFPFLGDRALMSWLNIYVIYTDRWNLESQLAKILQMPQYFLKPWIGENRKLYFGTYWKHELSLDNFHLDLYKIRGLL